MNNVALSEILFSRMTSWFTEIDSETGEEEEYFDARQFIDEGDDDDTFTAEMPSSASKRAQEKPDRKEMAERLKRLEAELYSGKFRKRTT